ncbi:MULTISPECIES: hypothetical protein [Streptomyces]|jgi:hypothetical protein|uniref:Secreted protein n=1 Tax=Streptomyces werraensis TaxID=68284 RepID=A0ABV3JH86_9ACTN|nr:hypothetical protein [Streptomyces sp. GB4-14]MCP9997706.1 hypothetical protein [Streptomyces werraensis]GHE81972.1 hypothetical protein GCM10018789_06870 [Streptomyces werraensis]
MKNSVRISTIAGTAAVITLALAPLAQANWSSSITGASVGFESRRWSDELYSQVQFTNCRTDGSKSTDVQMWNDISLQPDESYDNKTFTACFSGGTSNGEWTDLPSGKRDYYFKIMKIGGSTFGPQLSVSTVTVDTTKADG